MNYSKMISAYSNSERQALVESDDPHLMIQIMFDELLKAMTLFAENVDKKTGDKKIRSSQFTRALTILYTLQSSLDFEKGGEIATNLFKIYEYSRQQMLLDIKAGESDRTKKAMAALDDIRDAWTQIGAGKKVQTG